MANRVPAGDDTFRQALRLRRFLLASSVSLLYVAVLAVFFLQDRLPGRVLIDAATIVVVAIGAFLILFLTGINRRRRDASLTTEQLLASIFTMLFVLYQAPETRLAFSSFFFLAFMFGMLRLATMQLAVIGLISLAAFGFVIWLRHAVGRDGDALQLDLLQWSVLALTLPWFLLIGQHIRRLRKGLADASHHIESIAEQARRDELTGLYNRRAMMAALHQAQRTADSSGEAFSLCLIDIDHFKRVNDTIGHLAGDELLRRLAHAMRDHARTTDVLARYGGEEFLQILRLTRLPGALAHAERLRERISALDLSDCGQTAPVTVSIGLAEYRPGESTMQTLARSDAALYEAKQAGRNRVVSL